MCNYSEYLIEKGIEKGKLDILEQLEAEHFSDERILKFLRINAEQLKSLREMLREKRAAVMADWWLGMHCAFCIEKELHSPTKSNITRLNKDS